MLKKLGIALSVAALYSSSAFAGSTGLLGAEGTVANIEKALNEAVATAERWYEENGGADLTSNSGDSKNLLTSNTANPYLAKLQISQGYKVELQLQPAGATVSLSSNDSFTSPVAKGFSAAKIVLIPNKSAGDEKITGWECLTTLDSNIQEFKGKAAATEYKPSIIREYTNNKYLSLCVYAATLTLGNPV